MDHQAMMANMQAEQKKLDDLVAQMNAAKGPEKVRFSRTLRDAEKHDVEHKR